MGGPGTLIDLAVRGPLHIVPLSFQDKHALYVHFDGDVSKFVVGQTAPAAGTQSPEEAFKQGMRAPFVAVYEPDGKLNGIRGSTDVPSLVHQLWWFFAASLQASNPSPGATEWTSDERDSIAQYTAVYRLNGSDLERQKRDYASTPGRASAYRIVRGTAKFQLDSSRELVSFLEEDDLKIDGVAPMPSFDSHTRIELRKTGTERRANLDDLAAKAAALAVIDPKAKSREAQREIDQARMAGLKMPDVLASLSTFREREAKGTLSKEESNADGRAFVALTTMLRTNPAEIVNAKAHVEAGGPISDKIVAALRDAGTPDAQRALGELLDSPKTPRDQRLGIVRAISGVKTPTQESVKLLLSLEKDPNVGNQARFGLGSQASYLEKSDPNASKDILDHLMEELRSATTENDKCTLLKSLGNAGAAASVSTIEPFFRQPSAMVRACAAQAVRSIPGGEVDAMLVQALGDTVEDVRWSVLDAISERVPNDLLVKAVSQEAIAETAQRVRNIAVQTAGRWLSTRPDLAAVLATVAEKDQSEDLRRIARNALARKK